MIKKYLRSIGYCIVVLGVIALSASLGNAQETTTQTPSYVALDNTNFISCSTGAYGSLYDALESTDTTIATLASGTAKTNLIKRVQYVEAWYYAKCAESRIVAGLMGSEGEVRDAFSWYQKAKTRAQALEVNANANDTLETLLGKIHEGIMYEVTVTPQNTIDTITETPRAFPVACYALPTYTEFLSGKDMMDTTVIMNPEDFDLDEKNDAVTFIPSKITASQHQSVTSQDSCLFECKVNATWDGSACVGEIRVTVCQGNVPTNAQEVNGNAYEEQFNITTEQWEPIGRSQWTLQDDGDNNAGSCLYTCATGYHDYEGQCVQNMCQQSAPQGSSYSAGASEVTTGPEKAWTYIGPTIATPNACEWTCDSGYGRDSATNTCVATTTAQACGGSVGIRGIPSGTTTYVQTLNETFVNGEWVSSYIPTSKDWVYDATGAVSECTWTCPADYPFEYQGSCYSHYHEHDSANQILEKQAQSGPQSGQNYWHKLQFTYGTNQSAAQNKETVNQYCREIPGARQNAEGIIAQTAPYSDSGLSKSVVRYSGTQWETVSPSQSEYYITKIYCY